VHLIDRLIRLHIREFEDGRDREGHHPKAGGDDETNALHAAPPQDVLKRRISDIQDKAAQAHITLPEARWRAV
jgi:hypothetical protein